MKLILENGKERIQSVLGPLMGSKVAKVEFDGSDIRTLAQMPAEAIRAFLGHLGTKVR